MLYPLIDRHGPKNRYMHTFILYLFILILTLPLCEKSSNNFKWKNICCSASQFNGEIFTRPILTSCVCSSQIRNDTGPDVLSEDLLELTWSGSTHDLLTCNHVEHCIHALLWLTRDLISRVTWSHAWLVITQNVSLHDVSYRFTTSRGQGYTAR